VNPICGSWSLDRPLELLTNTSATRTGGADPTGFVRDGRMWRAAYFAAGPASLCIWVDGAALRAEAWGAGASDALASVPNFVGLTDDGASFDSGLHPLVRDVARARPGVRLIRTEAIFDAAVQAILGQKVTGLQAKRSFQLLARRAGRPAPLPRVSRRPLLLPPAPADMLRALSGHGATSLGIDVTRAATLREVALVAHHLLAMSTAPASDAAGVRAALERIPGVGVWTANRVTLTALGDADAVAVGDYHLKNFVAFALAGEPRGTDERMVELLEPFRPHRARAVRLIELSGVRPPRYGPRMSVPDHVPGMATRPGPSHGAPGRSRRSRSPRRAR
jgi:3-methyladenine DNA glycosylase/8-oxoguanine DNA glycosylase